MTSPSPTRSVMMQSQLQHGRNNLYGSPLPQVKMSKESMDKSIDRLYRMKPPPKDPGPLTESKTLPKTQVDESVARLYEQAIQKRKTIAEGHEKKYLTREPAKKIPPDDMAESVQRVYAQAMKLRTLPPALRRMRRRTPDGRRSSRSCGAAAGTMRSCRSGGWTKRTWPPPTAGCSRSRCSGRRRCGRSWRRSSWTARCAPFRRRPKWSGTPPSSASTLAASDRTQI
eukprot:TRINITY_DN1558_c0_g3_i2.p2 TRINITY_DN1558_c0_g3~~TRINITY_DN1558_c0_g3_i2.p2  ORF type:complete len:227 (+),score=42.04 TRINITY_DN1558_c0_g3_i2:67-747(+)